MQQKYLDQVDALYQDYHVVKYGKPFIRRLPLKTGEIRGKDLLLAFSQYLLEPYVPPSATQLPQDEMD